MKCPKCASDNLVQYTERHFSYERAITKKGTISKQKPIIHDVSYGMPEYIHCKECNSMFEYAEADNGKITLEDDIENPFYDKYA